MADNFPCISVIIPCRNEKDYIAGILDSILNANYPTNLLKILVCDGLSDDGTQGTVEKYAVTHSNIHLLINHKKTTPFAFNLGIKNSLDCDIIMTVSAHAKVYPDFFESIVKAFAISEEIGCVGGVLDNVYQNNTAKIIGLAMSSSFGVGNAYFRTGTTDGYVDTVGFPAYKKEVFDKVGLFNEVLVRNQDDEFNYRVAKAGYKIYLSKSIRSMYFVRGSFSKLFKQYYQYGYWKVCVNKMHKTVTSVRQLFPPAFVLFLFVSFILPFVNSLAIPYLVVLLLYILLATFYALKTVDSFRQIVQVIATFFILHFSYGAGFLKGIIDFVIIKKDPTKINTTLSR